MKDKLKSFFLNHGEKLGFGLIIAMALYVLWGTRWSPYEKTPQLLVAEAKEAEQDIANSTWPEERKLELEPEKDIKDRGMELQRGINSVKYTFSTDVFTPIYPRSEPILPPKFLTVDHPIAMADVFLMETAPDRDALTEEGEDETTESPEDDKSEIPEALRTRTPSTNDLDALSELGGGCGEDYPADLLGESYGAAPDGYPGGCGDEGYPGLDGAKVSRNGEGYRFVAVRAILDWAAQKRAYAKALHLSPLEAERAEPRILDFEIQRQQATGGENIWGPWETLDIKTSVDVLMKALDFEADVVDVTVTNPVITEPLPRRVIGVWNTPGSHPRIENYVLSDEERKIEQLRQQKLMEAYEEIKKNQPPEQVQPGGFGAFMQDIRAMQNELSSADLSDYESEYQKDMEGMYSNYPGGGPGNFGNARTPGAPGASGSLLTTSARSAASGRLLLFRYFDFEVDPGAVYRYRIRIKYENPNFGKPIELLASPELAEGQIRTSDWSEPTDAVQVRPKAEFYLTGVEYDRRIRSDAAVMDLYKWNAPTGTVVNQLKRYTIGDEIGGVVETKVVNPLDKSFEAEKIKVNTENFVIDLRDQDDLQVDSDLLQQELGKVPNGIRYDEVLVMNEHGNLRTYDRFTRESERVVAKRFQKFQNDLGKEYEEAAKKAVEAEDLLSGGGYGGEEGGYGGYGGGSRAPGAAASKRPRRRSYGGGGGGY